MRLFAAEKDAARGREAGSGTGGGCCRSERRSRSSGRRQKLRWPETTRLFAARRWGAWMGGWFRHRWGWLLLGEALQIQWSPAKTEVAGDGGRRRTMADGGRMRQTVTVL